MDAILFLLVGSLPFLLIALLVSIVIGATSSVELPEPVFPKRLGWAVLVGLVGLNVFAYDSSFGIGLGVFVAALCIAALLAFEPERRTPIVWCVTLLGVCAGLAFGWRANEFVGQVNAAVAVLSLAALLLLRAVDHEDWHGLWVLGTAGRVVKRALLHLPGFGRSLRRGKDQGKSGLLLAVRTAVVTVVVLVFFATLLSAADPVFDKMIVEIREQIAGRAILSVLLAAFLVLSLTIRAVERRATPHRLTFLSFQEVFVPVAGMIALFAGFLFVQAKYLFGSHEAIQAFGITYSDYVRSGFVELLLATFFGSLVAYVVILKRHAASGRQAGLLTGVNVLLVIELFLMLGSALKRDWLYMDVYGLTRVRIIGEIFLAWLGVILLLLLALNAVPRMRERHFLGGLLAASAAVFVVLNAMNMDMRIARHEPPRDQPKDLYYLSLLSADAAGEWPAMIREAASRLAEAEALTGAPSPELKGRLADAKLAAIKLLRHRFELADWPEGTLRWQDWNASERAARDVIAASEDLFHKDLPCLVLGIEQWQLRDAVELYEEEQKRVFEYEYPFVFHERYDGDFGRSLETIKGYPLGVVGNAQTLGWDGKCS
jgi:hypothetical protein